jgi:hypothetical protein
MDQKTDVEEWPACLRRRGPACEGEVDPARWALGIRWCHHCADGRKSYPSIQMHKSSAIIVTDKEQLKYAGVKTPRE